MRQWTLFIPSSFSCLVRYSHPGIQVSWPRFLAAQPHMLYGLPWKRVFASKSRARIMQLRLLLETKKKERLYLNDGLSPKKKKHRE